MELRHVRLSDPEVGSLLAGLAEEYECRYGPGDEMISAQPEEFDLPGGTFLILVSHGETLAGGGIRRWSADTCEVKRMWSAPDHRRRGLASAVLDSLQQAARDLGYTFVRAETGPLQPEAIALYTNRGFDKIPTYGPYPAAMAFERKIA